MTDINIHNIKSIELGPVREHQDFSARSIYLETDQGRVEITLYSRSDDENALKVMS